MKKRAKAPKKAKAAAKHKPVPFEAVVGRLLASPPERQKKRGNR